MKSTIAKKYLTFILLLSGMFSFSVAEAQFICDCTPSHPAGYCYVDTHGNTKCEKFHPGHGGGFLVDNQVAVSTSISIFPNPASNSTTISFSLEQSQKISLKVFDMDGRLVSTLADTMFEEGKNEILWKTDNVNTGVYFLEFQSAEKLLREKLFVTK